MTSRFWKIGFSLQLAFTLAASALAYLGVLRLDIPGFPRADFLGHFLAMGALAFFADGLARHRRVLVVPLRLGPLLVFVAAAIDELAQRFSSRRNSSVSDLLADALGVTLGAVIASLVVEIAQKGEGSGREALQ
jgi:VanZ family protein